MRAHGTTDSPGSATLLGEDSGVSWGGRAWTERASWYTSGFQSKEVTGTCHTLARHIGQDFGKDPKLLIILGLGVKGS